MAARDKYHEATKNAIIKMGWVITHDPYMIELLNTTASIDLGAERLLAAEKDSDKIAIEVKTFKEPSWVYDFHLALGQYFNYSRALKKLDKDRFLYLSVTEEVYLGFFLKSDVQDALKDFKISLIVINTTTESVVEWLHFSY